MLRLIEGSQPNKEACSVEMTGKTKEMMLGERCLTLHNQRCKAWTHPYPYQGEGNLSNSGCGIFALCHAAQWLTGNCPDAEKLADFSVAWGGRGDDGTDRPALLQALMDHGENTALGFRYDGDGLRNDLETLYHHLAHEHGAALCNLRVGHIVALVAAREVDGVRQLLAIDSYSESATDKVRDHVLEVIPASAIDYEVRNADGLVVGENRCYSMFWVDASLPRDFNLLHPLR